MRTITKCRGRTFRMLTCPGNVFLVKDRNENRCMLLILCEKASFEKKVATRNPLCTQLQPLTCWVRDQLNFPHSRRPWLSATNTRRMIPPTHRRTIRFRSKLRLLTHWDVTKCTYVHTIYMLAVQAGIRCSKCLRDLLWMHIPSVLVILLVTEPTPTQRKLFFTELNLSTIFIRNCIYTI